MLNAIDLQRVAARCERLHVPVVPRLLYYAGLVLYNSALPPSTRIGRGTKCAYGGIGVVIHRSAVIGDGVVIGQGVTIGGRGKRGGAPVIEDGVFIGAGARILGPVRVGEHSFIAPNAVVIHDVPPRCVVGGVPARILRRDVDIEEFT